MLSGTWVGFCEQVYPCVPFPARYVFTVPVALFFLNNSAIQAAGTMIATPINSLTARSGMVIHATPALTFENVEAVGYAVMYAESVGTGVMPSSTKSELIEWFAV